MTNRERARDWLLSTFPSSWEADHLWSLTKLLDEVGGTPEIRRIYDGGRVLIRVSRKDIGQLKIGDRVAIRVLPKTTKKPAKARS